MDTHSSHLAAQNRSRSSQTPSPSHSAASASVTSSIHLKRKLSAVNAAASEDHAPPFPPSSISADTRDGALTSNDDLESISARGGGGDSDSDSDEDAAMDDEEEDFDNDNNGGSSIRTFTAARLESTASGRNPKIKSENPAVKIEKEDSVKDGGSVAGAAPTGAAATAAAGSGTGLGPKDDAVKIFTENLQTSGAYSAREENLKREEEAGRLKFACYSNDGVDDHMVNRVEEYFRKATSQHAERIYCSPCYG